MDRCPPVSNCPRLPFPELRPKGRGRPQRILLGVWPEETVNNVIRAVVFRDTSGLKEQMESKAAAVAAAAAAAAAKVGSHDKMTCCGSRGAGARPERETAREPRAAGPAAASREGGVESTTLGREGLHNEPAGGGRSSYRPASGYKLQIFHVWRMGCNLHYMLPYPCYEIWDGSGFCPGEGEGTGGAGL